MFYTYWCVFFFKQKTAYYMRISYWSSDVCSSDLLAARGLPVPVLRGTTVDRRRQAQILCRSRVRGPLRQGVKSLNGPVVEAAAFRYTNDLVGWRPAIPPWSENTQDSPENRLMPHYAGVDASSMGNKVRLPC